MRLRHVSVVITLVWLLALQAYASNTENVRGVVHDPNHRPIQGAQVTLRAGALNRALATQSDAEGEFLFQDVSPGELRNPGSSPELCTGAAAN